MKRRKSDILLRCVWAILIIVSSSSVWAQTSPLSAEQRATFHGQMSEPVEPFHIVGNIYYVGARNIASYLITTPQGHIMIDTGTKEMHQVIRTNVAKLGFKLQDIKILLSGHAHFDHVQGHAAMQKATGAKVMAIGPDAAALSAGADMSPLGDEGWEAVKVDRILKDGATVTLGGATLRAIWTPGHTPGCTTWTTTAQEKGKSYSIVFQACGAPNAGVKLVGNTKFPMLVEDAVRSFSIQKTLKPDIYLPMHPESYFAGKVERIKAGETPHPLLDPGGYSKLIAETEINFQKRVEEERAKSAKNVSNEPAGVQQHVDTARTLASTRYKTAMERLCLPPNKRPRPTFGDLNIEPVRLFDNLYLVGLANVYSWVVDTPDGIVVLDTLNNAKDAEVTIVGGMKKLGLDPARIKYVVITHAHGDHFGGAPYLKEHYGARVMASAEGWHEMEQIKPGGANFVPPPQRDMIASDGQKLTVGGTAFTFLVTPGHTRGTVSVIVPVTDNGQRHMAYVLSGPRTETSETTTQMLASTEKLMSLAKSAHVDVALTNHSYVDDSLPVVEAIRHRKSGEPNAYVVGEEGVQKYLGWQAECLRADIARSGR